MLQAFFNIFRIADLRNKVFFTLGALIIYRIGFWIPLVGVDQTALAEAAKSATESETGFGRIAQFASIFSGGSLSQSTIFGLGIMPYITAAIIFQLLQSVVPTLQELKKEGASGQQKITEWTRYATVGLCIVQGMMWLTYLKKSNLVQPMFLSGGANMVFFAAGIIGLTAGSLFLMWLGEQIDKYGIGNGVSIILTAGILSQLPSAVGWVVENFNPSQVDGTSGIGIMSVIFLAAAFVFVTAGAIVITVAQRRIPIQQAKHTRGRKVVGGQRHYLLCRVNHAGVMPIIFASSLMIFPRRYLVGLIPVRRRATPLDGGSPSQDSLQTTSRSAPILHHLRDHLDLLLQLLLDHGAIQPRRHVQAVEAVRIVHSRNSSRPSYRGVP